jgi:lipopolysaccharide/colanic/teichoic acid biosynthesis glycosyltransferase
VGPGGRYARLVKPLGDRLVAAILVIVTAPLLAIAAALVYARMGRPVLFVQERPGLHGRPFRLLKLRTMRDARDAEGRPLPDGERLTRLGRTLRTLSLDELPQLVNVLRGEMSLIGPRPLLMAYLPRYSARQARRHEVRPGVTGWAQVRGRNALDWDERFELDVWYVDHVSPALDLRIAALTALALVRPSGVARAGHATMPEFRGAVDRAGRGADGADTPGGRA